MAAVDSENVPFGNLKPINGESPFKAALAAYLVRSKLQEDLGKIDPENLSPDHVDLGATRKGELPPRPTKCNTGEEHIPKDQLLVGIIGAGIAGLYTAYLLDHIGVPYNVLEASDRIGGRLYTHKFSDKKHDYYDVGAMRFPNTPIMRRTFDLSKRCKLELGEYIMKDEEHQPARYNDQTAVGDLSKMDDPFRVSTEHGGNVPPETVRDPDVIMDDAFDRFRRKIKRAIESTKEEDPYAAWKYLMNHDRYSLRDYLSFVEGYDYETIHWLETIGSATNWFDEAFTENVLESLAFDYISASDVKEKKQDRIEIQPVPPPPPAEDEKVQWKFIEGGSIPIEPNKRVTAIGLPEVHTMEHSAEDQKIVSVTVDGESAPRQYASVINTTTLAALQKMDLTRLKLPYATKAAIRSLRYDPSTKVAIKFKEGWWMDKPHNIRGGLGKTDMPIRVCVYPSYNLKDAKNESNVLLCSYSWGQDSERIAAMVPSPGMEKEEAAKLKEQLKHTMLTNLARLHTPGEDPDQKRYNELLKRLDFLCEDIHGYDWSKDAYTGGGAFALYAPGQFSHVYASLVRPAADARFHIVGEAASAHHAWVVGALDSAYRGVWAFLERFHMHDLQDQLHREFGDLEEMTDMHLQVAFGRLWPKQQPPPAAGAAVVLSSASVLDGAAR